MRTVSCSKFLSEQDGKISGLGPEGASMTISVKLRSNVRLCKGQSPRIATFRASPKENIRDMPQAKKRRAALTPFTPKRLF
jgi:hypothetical protein